MQETWIRPLDQEDLILHGQGSLAGCSPWGHKESDTAEHERAHHICKLKLW